MSIVASRLPTKNELRELRSIDPQLADIIFLFPLVRPTLKERLHYQDHQALNAVWDLLLKRAEALMIERMFELERELDEAKLARESNDMNIFAMQYEASVAELADVSSVAEGGSWRFLPEEEIGGRD